MANKPKTIVTDDLTTDTAAPAAPTKKARLIANLQDPAGATIADICTDLGWLPHTVRAALTGLRKAGLEIERNARADGATTYTIRTEA